MMSSSKGLMVYTTSLIGGFFFRFTAPAHTSDRLGLELPHA